MYASCLVAFTMLLNNLQKLPLGINNPCDKYCAPKNVCMSHNITLNLFEMGTYNKSSCSFIFISLHGDTDAVQQEHSVMPRNDNEQPQVGKSLFYSYILQDSHLDHHQIIIFTKILYLLHFPDFCRSVTQIKIHTKHQQFTKGCLHFHESLPLNMQTMSSAQEREI